jgi:hypothetical protein
MFPNSVICCLQQSFCENLDEDAIKCKRKQDSKLSLPLMKRPGAPDSPDEVFVAVTLALGMGDHFPVGVLQDFSCDAGMRFPDGTGTLRGETLCTACMHLSEYSERQTMGVEWTGRAVQSEKMLRALISLATACQEDDGGAEMGLVEVSSLDKGSFQSYQRLATVL